MFIQKEHDNNSNNYEKNMFIKKEHDNNSNNYKKINCKKQ